MSAVTGTPEPFTSAREETGEERRVKEWNRDRMVALGLDEPTAALAAEAGLSWHELDRIMARGCSAQRALAIAA